MRAASGPVSLAHRAAHGRLTHGRLLTAGTALWL